MSVFKRPSQNLLHNRPRKISKASRLARRGHSQSICLYILRGNTLTATRPVHMIRGIANERSVACKEVKELRRKQSLTCQYDVLRRPEGNFSLVKEINIGSLSVFETWSNSCQNSVAIHKLHPAAICFSTPIVWE